MDTVLVVRDTFDVQFFRMDFASLMDAFACKCKQCQADIPISYEGIWITSIICLTVILLTLLVIGLILYIKSKNISDKSNERKEKDDAENNQREKEREAEIEKEKNLYISRLANFMEKRSVKKVVKCVDNEEIEYTIFEYDENNSIEYINTLKDYIKELSSKLEKQSMQKGNAND